MIGQEQKAEVEVWMHRPTPTPYSENQEFVLSIWVGYDTELKVVEMTPKMTWLDLIAQIGVCVHAVLRERVTV